MSLIGKFLNKALTKGSLTLKRPGHDPETFGRGGGKHVTVRFTDRKVAFDVLRKPPLGLGEAYMDGRVVIEDGTILDLIDLITSANPWEDRRVGPRPLAKRKSKLLSLFRRNGLRRARRNVAHHYDLKDELYELFLDE